MDKYQLNLFNRIKFEVVEDTADFYLNNDAIEAIQPENAYIETINVTAYGTFLDKISINGIEYRNQNDSVNFVISFCDDIKSIKFSFKDGIVEDCEVPINLIKSDKAKWDEKQAKEKGETLNKLVNIDVRSDINLINIFFTYINDTKYVIADLYLEGRKIGCFRNSENQLFISIPNIVAGKYSIILNMYNSNDNLLFSTDAKEIEVFSMMNCLSKIKEATKDIQFGHLCGI